MAWYEMSCEKRLEICECALRDIELAEWCINNGHTHMAMIYMASAKIKVGAK